MASDGVEEAKYLGDYWRQYAQGFINKEQMRSVVQSIIDEVNPDEAHEQVLDIVHLMMGYFLGDVQAEEVDQALGVVAPSGPEEVKVMGPKDVEKKRDQLLDEMNNWPPGSPQHQDAVKQLQALGFSRFAIKIMAYDSHDQVQENINELAKAVGSRYGHLDDAVDAVAGRVSTFPENERAKKAAEVLVGEVWPLRLSTPGGGEDDYWDLSEAVEAFGDWLEGAYYWP